MAFAAGNTVLSVMRFAFVATPLAVGTAVDRIVKELPANVLANAATEKVAAPR